MASCCVQPQSWRYFLNSVPIPCMTTRVGYVTAKYKNGTAYYPILSEITNQLWGLVKARQTRIMDRLTGYLD